MQQPTFETKSNITFPLTNVHQLGARPTYLQGKSKKLARKNYDEKKKKMLQTVQMLEKTHVSMSIAFPVIYHLP